MATLQNLCLSSIENTGTDLKKVLAETRNSSLEEAWQRHPVLKIIVHNKAVHGGFGWVIFVITTIRITFTGIYTFELETKFRDSITEHELAFIRRNYPQFIPTQSKEIFSQELSPEEEEKLKKMLLAEIEWERIYRMSIEVSPLTEQELEQKEIEAHQKARGHFLIDKVLKFVLDCTAIWILLVDPNTGIVRLEMGHYEHVHLGTMKLIKSSLNSAIEFIRSTAFC